MTRVVVLTFFGPRRWRDDAHPHESPAIMVIPIVVLSLGAVFAGWALDGANRLERWLEPVTGFAEPEPPIPIPAITGLTLLVTAIGVGVAVAMYGRRPVPVTPPLGAPLTVAARRDLYGDAFNEAVFMRPGQAAVASLAFADNRIVDGAVNGTGALFGGLSARMRRLQTGFVRSYALTILGGTVLVVAAMALVRL
jgi:NADH-quinone oxidoreductase subunit L